MSLTRPLRNQFWPSTLMVVGLALLAKFCGALNLETAVERLIPLANRYEL